MKLKIRHGTWLALLLVPLFASFVSAQTYFGPFTFTGTACVDANVEGQSQIAMTISGTWTGTIQPKVAVRGQAAANTQVVPSTSSTAASTITANGIYTSTVAGYTTFSLCGNTVSGGSATVTFSVTQRSAAGRGAGGGSPGGVAGGDLSGTYPNPTVVNINGTAFSGNTGRLVSFGASNTPVDSGLVAANQVNATAPGVGLCHFAGSTQTCTSSAVNLAGADVTGVLPFANGQAGATLSGFCTGTVGTANTTAYGLAPYSNATTCLSVIGANNEQPPPFACTARNLAAHATVGGATAGSGVITLYKNNVATALTCTLGTGSNTKCTDTTHTVALATTDQYSLRVTTNQATDTTANPYAVFVCTL